MLARGAGNRIWNLGFAALVAAGTIVIVGCGDANRATVSGKVTANGAPVTGGGLDFTPEGGGGRPATCQIGKDGSYTVSEGVVIGKNLISYTAPMGELPPDPKPGDVPGTSEFAGMKPKEATAEVKSGSNTIDIELVAPGA